jgi:hypothetical protein
MVDERGTDPRWLNELLGRFRVVIDTVSEAKQTERGVKLTLVEVRLALQAVAADFLKQVPAEFRRREFERFCEAIGNKIDLPKAN